MFLLNNELDFDYLNMPNEINIKKKKKKTVISNTYNYIKNYLLLPILFYLKDLSLNIIHTY